MSKTSLGKWQQYLLLHESPLTAPWVPETSLYTVHNLSDLLNRHDFVFVKHDTSGQGRGIYKVYKNAKKKYDIDGFTLQGDQISKSNLALTEIHSLLHPYERLGRLSSYIIQEGIKSTNLFGDPFSIRVHIQKLKGEWIVGGIYSKIGLPPTLKNGIVNSHRGATVISIEELLTTNLNMEEAEKKETIQLLKKVAAVTAKVIDRHYPSREFGLDFGLNSKRDPVLFEVNTTPGIGGFAKIENKALWKRIIEIRKLQNEN